ncbi:hypothetical protein A2U01_0046948, partial [Trifolium medium]|nr:hypothetical protein [Trifolium medium]
LPDMVMTAAEDYLDLMLRKNPPGGCIAMLPGVNCVSLRCRVAVPVEIITVHAFHG